MMEDAAMCLLSAAPAGKGLLLALRQGAGIRGHLDANLIRITIDVAQGSLAHFVHKGGGVFAK
jgi:hypothetical protein